MSMKYISMELGPIMTNCYVVYDTDTKDAMVVDPAWDYPRIDRTLASHDLQLKFIFLTHGHVFGEKKLPAGPACDVLVQGHTHLMKLEPADKEQGRPVILNTGSPTFPKGGNPPSFATYSGRVLALRSLDGSALNSLRL